MKRTLLNAAAMLAFFTATAQEVSWQPVRKGEIPSTEISTRESNPKDFLLYHLNLTGLKSQLAQAPLRGSGQTSTVVIALPDGNGQLQHFTVYNAPVMEAGLAAKHTEIQSYVGQGVEHPTTLIRFTTTLYGLHVMALESGGNTWYIDPYTKQGDYYIIYKKSNLQTAKTFKCLTENEAGHQRLAAKQAQAALAPLDNGNWRTYRAAILGTVEYSAFHVNEAGLQEASTDEKKAAVLAAVSVTITRVNSMMERDLSVSLQLVENEEDILFIDSDEVNNDDAGALLNEGNTVIYETIGADNFDIGHSFGTGGGGLAAGAPCSDFKAGAMTGVGSPVGDPFDIDYVAHEMGHQFGMPHTFNAECGGNRDGANAYEPGGGTTIMAYAGVCDPVIQWHSDAQYHATSIAHMRNRINGESNCVAATPTGNTPPVANAGADYVIPKGTAFILEGSGTDANNDVLTYDWEQMNTEISVQPPVSTAVGGPNFRSLPISDSPDRWMPQIEEVLAGNLFPQWEVIPTVAREMDFALTVRDNNINGGESATDFMRIDVSGQAGPFVVTSPNNAVTWAAATNHTITWDVAGTNANGVNAQLVDIFLSADGGYTYPVVLAEGVPNDGSENILLPDTATTQGRIMVRGHNNIFYDINNANITITAAGSTFLATISGDATRQVCKGSNAAFTVNLQHLNGFSGAVSLSATGQPSGSTVTFSPANATAAGEFQVAVTNTGSSSVGEYNIVVSMAAGGETKTVTLHLSLLSTDFAELQPVAPENNDNTVPTTVLLDWTNDLIASSYHVQVATDAAFADIVAESTTTNSQYTVSGLIEGTQYYWRVKSANAGCEGAYNTASVFSTGQTFCNDYISQNVPLVITDADVSTGTSTITVTDGFTLNNVSVVLDMNHTWLSDIIATLISPAGTEVVLFSGQCGDQDDVNATFSDNGSPLTCSGTPTLSGILAPQQALSALTGESAAGTWTLKIEDTFAQDGGVVNSWGVVLCGLEATPLSTQTPSVLDNFALWPNPNKGSFTVQFTANEGPATVTVYDLRGRVIHSQTETAPAGLYRAGVQLNAQQGIYLVSAEQNGRRTVKKIVVE